MGWGALSLPLVEGVRVGRGKTEGAGVLAAYKKNLGSPLTTVRINSSLSVGFFGMGLQNAKGSQQASSDVRYRWWAVMVAHKHVSLFHGSRPRIGTGWKGPAYHQLSDHKLALL